MTTISDRTTLELASTLRQRLAESLSESRLAHVMGVEGLSVALAEKWGINTHRTMLAALFHDLMKAAPREQQKKLATENSRFPVTDQDLNFPAMWHGIAAAKVAENEYSISDLEILEAVAWHTTGNRNMSPIGMALYVADFLEPTRHFPGVENYRKEILDMEMHHAALRISELKLQNVRNMNRPVHPRTEAMKSWLEETLNPST